ncbi:MAG: hypothetical protein KC912_16835 [Proteobacteria bacterium]|nr:hypothetical protein [Pseudomonadota bacterium]
MNKLMLGVALLALAACNGESATVTDSGVETGDTDTGTDTGTVSYDTVAYITMIATFGYDQPNDQFVDYTLTSQGQSASQAPAIILRLSDATPTAICDVYIQGTSPIANTTTLPGDVTTPMGLVIDAGTATVSDGGALGLTACSNLDPEVWGADIAAAVNAGGQDFGFVVTGPMYSSHALWGTVSGGLTNFGTEWDPYILSGSSYIEASGVQMGLVTAGGSPTEIGLGRSYAFATGTDVGDLGTATYVAKADALTTSGAFNMQSLTMPFTSADKAQILGQ